MPSKTVCALCGTLVAAVAALAVVPAAPPVPQNPIPAPPAQLDPPLPPGAADDIAARIAARRAAQLTQGAQAPAPADTVQFKGRTPEQIEAEMLARRAELHALQAAADAQASQTQVIGPATTLSPTATMAMHYESATLDQIFDDMSRAFGFIVIKSQQINQRMTIQAPNPVSADEALRMLDTALYVQGFGTLRTPSGEDPATAKTIVRIGSIAEIKKSLIPIYEGADPDKIAITDMLITQIIPMQNIAAPGMRNDLISLVSADADVSANAGANCIIITDTSAKIHRLVTLIAALDKVAADRAAIPAPAGRGGITRPSDVPFIMSAVVDGAAFQIRHGDILGEVQSPKATLTAPAAGILAKINAQEGQAVKAGDLVCEFDTHAAQTELQTAQAHLLEVRSQLLPPGAARGDIERNQAEIAAAEAVVARDRFVLESLQVRAPIDGTLTSFDFTPGQYLAAGTALTQIVDNQAEDFKLSFRLAFNDRTLLKVGRKITFTVSDKLPPFPAEITFISPTADTSNRTEVRARFVGKAEPLVPGVSRVAAVS